MGVGVCRSICLYRSLSSLTSCSTLFAWLQFRRCLLTRSLSPATAVPTQNRETEGLLGLSLPVSQSLNLCQQLLSLLQFPGYQVLDSGQLPRGECGMGVGASSARRWRVWAGAGPAETRSPPGEAQRLFSVAVNFLGACEIYRWPPLSGFSQSREGRLPGPRGWIRSESALRPGCLLAGPQTYPRYSTGELSTGGWLLRGRVFLLDQVQGQHPI